jgi:FixJ family two-component response regulator
MISIVDDDVGSRQGINDLVASMGYPTATFASAEEFLESASVRETACVIADLHMPGLNGLELQNRLIDEGHSVSFIIVTAFPDEQCRARALAAGAAGFLTKPFDDKALLRCLTAAVGRASPTGPEVPGPRS